LSPQYIELTLEHKNSHLRVKYPYPVKSNITSRTGFKPTCTGNDNGY